MRTPPALLALVPLLPLALSACGGSAEPRDLIEEGQAALSSGDFAAAGERFDEALAALEASGETDDAIYVEAALGSIEARIRTAPEQARTDFLELVASRPSALEPRDFSYVGNKFAGASRFSEAIDVLDAGMKAHAESPQLKELQVSITERATKAGDKAALDKLSGLGYL